MNINIVIENGIGRISLAGEITIYSAAQTKEKLLSAIADSSEVWMDLVHVKEIDATGLQLLALAKSEAERSNKPLHFVAHSQTVLDMLDLCHLSGVFGEPMMNSSGQA